MNKNQEHYQDPTACKAVNHVTHQEREVKMPNKRRINLDRYNISKFAYDELKGFCLQHAEKKQRLLDLRCGIRAQTYSDMPHSTELSDNTAKYAILAAKLSTDIEQIEQSAIEADSGIYEYIILGVTQQGVDYEILKGLKNIPCGRRYYYDRRRKFFYLLALKKGDI